MRPLRVVVDCNIIISLLIGGSMKNLREYLLSPAVHLIISEVLLAEVIDVGSRGHLRKYFDRSNLHQFVDLLHDLAELNDDTVRPPKISRDPDDDYLLALCKSGKADVLLTGDNDLLVLEKYGRTRILSARSFVKEYLS